MRAAMRRRRWRSGRIAWRRGRPERPPEGRRACAEEARACPRDVYVYFDNDAKVRAPFDAMALEKKVAERLGRSGAEGESHPSATRTEGASGSK